MVSVMPLRSKDQTGKEMHRLINRYSGDLRNVYVKRGGKLIPFSDLSMREAFDFVRRMPYRRDVKPIEVVSRPREIVKNYPVGMDCKKKAILLSSYLRENRYPYRLIASSRRPDGKIHHVFPQVRLSGNWRNLDATYSYYRPFEKKSVTRAEVLR
jgi:hypothetical protein